MFVGKSPRHRGGGYKLDSEMMKHVEGNFGEHLWGTYFLKKKTSPNLAKTST